MELSRNRSATPRTSLGVLRRSGSIATATRVRTACGTDRPLRFQTRAAERPHPREDPGPERRPRAGVRLAEVRTALPRTDRRRHGSRTRVRRLPARVQHRPTERGTGLKPPRRGALGPSRPGDPHLSRRRNPANYLTRDAHLPWSRRRMGTWRSAGKTEPCWEPRRRGPQQRSEVLT